MRKGFNFLLVFIKNQEFWLCLVEFGGHMVVILQVLVSHADFEVVVVFTIELQSHWQLGRCCFIVNLGLLSSF